MNKYQEALEKFADRSQTQHDFDLIKVTIDIISRPYEGRDSTCCRRCDEGLIDEHNFCPNCGIELDWSDEE